MSTTLCSQIKQTPGAAKASEQLRGALDFTTISGEEEMAIAKDKLDRVKDLRTESGQKEM